MIVIDNVITGAEAEISNLKQPARITALFPCKINAEKNFNLAVKTTRKAVTNVYERRIFFYMVLYAYSWMEKIMDAILCSMLSYVTSFLKLGERFHRRI